MKKLGGRAYRSHSILEGSVSLKGLPVYLAGTAGRLSPIFLVRPGLGNPSIFLKKEFYF